MNDAPRYIELLSPARDIEVGRAAIDHGADAVYIGASCFSARSAAGNSVEDIARLVDYAHEYGVRIYVTLNTILMDEELHAAETLVKELYDCGVDALIVQDMALLEMKLPPIELHASTQTDIRTARKARFLYDAGFTRLVLARELSIEQIMEIHNAVPNAEIEAFVHGALCVSYSGQCYMSQCFKSRSANRGRCSQVCRLPYTVRNAHGKIIERDTHVLSLKDMNRSSYIEQMIDAGVSSLKIEGRLKDISYVKNITAYYRGKIDEVLFRRHDLKRSSVGTSSFTFVPSPEKSFNRGMTSYYINGCRDEDVSFPYSPKSLGEKVGKVVNVKNGVIRVDTTSFLNNGDGFCYITPQGKFGGFRIDSSRNGELYPSSMPETICKGAVLYRNMDMDFVRKLSANTATRNIKCSFSLREEKEGFSLEGKTEDGYTHVAFINIEKQKARVSQHDNIHRILIKTGDTPYSVESVDIEMTCEFFIPSSILTAARRECTDSLTLYRKQTMKSFRVVKSHVYPSADVIFTDYRANVSNELSRSFYKKCHIDITQSYEQKHDGSEIIAWCKHCIRYALGKCPRETHNMGDDYAVLYIENGNVRMKAEFDCKECEMKLSAWE